MTYPVYTCVKRRGNRLVKTGSTLAGAGRPDPPRDLGTGKHLAVDLTQLCQRLFDLAPLTLQQIDLLHALLAADRERVGAAPCARSEHFADFGQSEPESFALQNQREAITIPVAIDTRARVSLGCEQTLALVKSQCAQREARLARKLADGKISGRKRLRRSLAAAAGSIDTA